MKNYEITLNEDSLRSVSNELNTLVDYSEVIPDRETRQYFEDMHRFILESVRGKLIQAFGVFTYKRRLESYVTVMKLKLNELEVMALYYELEHSREVIAQLQSIILKENQKQFNF